MPDWWASNLLEVLQSAGGERIAADTVYIIPPGRGLAIRDGVLELTDFAQPRGLRRPIDDFFLSLAADQQANAACVILSGTGADGTTGLRAIKENGGVCAVQQPESARYDGMPLSAVGTGLVDFVKPAGEILESLQGFFGRRRSDPAAEEEADVVADHIDDVGYLESVIDAVGNLYPVDRSRVFLTGHSNGGMMTYRFACEHPELIAGAASVAGTMLTPAFLRRSCVAGSASAFCIASCICVTTGAGVSFGKTRAPHEVRMKSFTPDSAVVGMSGRVGQR